MSIGNEQDIVAAGNPSGSDGRILVGHVRVDPFTMAETLDRVEQLLHEPGTHQHVVVNAAKVVEAHRNPELARVINGCEIVNADGSSVVWASKILRHALPERVAGIDFMDELLARSAARGWPVYFLGAKPEVVAETVAHERERHPGLQVAGFRDGYWSPDEEAGVVQDVHDSEARILLVAISSPRKELFVDAHRDRLGVGLVVGVGGSFDVVAGVTKRAPIAWQRAGMEWAYRLLQEPRRMWKRYLVGNSRFIGIVAAQAVNHR